MTYESLSVETEKWAAQIVDAALRVHTTLGPGLLESVYEACLVYELTPRGLAVQKQAVPPVIYEDVKIDAGLQLDLLVEDRVVVELKAVEKHLPVFDSQLLTYLKHSGHRLGLLINFNVPLIKDGIKRIVL